MFFQQAILEVNVFVWRQRDEAHRSPRYSEPEMTNEKKYRCPIDQEIYDSREDYDSHCKEEHDVL